MSLDNAVGNERSAAAAVSASEAAVRQAQLNLGYSKVTSLLGGIAGLAQVHVGDLVGPSLAGALTVVSTVNPIKVYYMVSEPFYLSFMQQFSPDGSPSRPRRTLEHELVLADGSIYPVQGELFALDRQVDARTGTIRAVALFPNPANFLRPGQFVRVRVLTGTRKGALLVPQRAVTEIQVSYAVAVVDSANTVGIRMVKVGERVGTLWIVEEGLRAGERVVVEGTQMARPGMKVRPKPFSLPSPSSRPMP
jgi:membrane fusion protein, multidrug efflux system